MICDIGVKRWGLNAFGLVFSSLALAALVRVTIISHEVRAPRIVRFDDCILAHIRG